MTDKDQRRLAILERLSSGTISNSQVCTLLGVGIRQLRRLRKEFASTGGVYGRWSFQFQPGAMEEVTRF